MKNTTDIRALIGHGEMAYDTMHTEGAISWFKSEEDGYIYVINAATNRATRYNAEGQNGKRIPIREYEEKAQKMAERQSAKEWEAEAEAERKAREDKMAADAKATEDAVNGVSEAEGAATEATPGEEVQREEKPKKTARKPRKSKDIAYEGHGVTLTAKQVDFIHHLPDTCFWEAGVDSVIWCDVLVDDIKGQFAEKPMTVGAMISTLCEKRLGIRTKERREGRKVTNFTLTELGKEIAKELGLE